MCRAARAERWPLLQGAGVAAYLAHSGRQRFRHVDPPARVGIFDKDMLVLYEAGYSHIDWNQRMSLGKSALGKWLHGFYATHATSYPYKVSTLHNLCGSEDKNIRSFRQKLRKALDELVNVEAIDSWDIDENDLVTVHRKPTASQQKHLKRKAKQR